MASTREWTVDEDGKPGARLVRPQPELEARGRVWMHRVDFEYPFPGYTYVSIRDCGDYVYEPCNLYRRDPESEDGA